MTEIDIREYIETTLFNNSFDVLIWEFLDSLVSDYSDFHYVDGEEGDYGIIRYTMLGDLIATKTVQGGDMEDLEFTDQGKRQIERMIRQAMESK